MKIAILSLHSSPYGALGTGDTGGMSIYIRETASHLAKQGHSIDIFTRRHQPDQAPVVELGERLRLFHLDAGPAVPIPKLSLYDHLDEFTRSMEKYSSIGSNGYNLIHSHYWLSACVGQKLHRRTGLPHFVTFHTLAAVKDRTGAAAPEPELRIVSENQIASACDHILTATDKEKQFTMRYYDVAAGKISVIPCGVNRELFRPLDKMKARKQLKIEASENVVLYVGRFDAMKGIDRIIESIALLNKDHSVSLILVGGDNPGNTSYDKIREQAVSFGVEKNVRFAGRVEHKKMPLFYCAADVVAVASHYESFGLVGLEALACGTPVVATRVGAMEQLINEHNGCLINSPSPPEIASGISRCLSTAFRKQYTVDGICFSSDGYDWARTAQGLQKVYANSS